jgi:hypothetical protein
MPGSIRSYNGGLFSIGVGLGNIGVGFGFAVGAGGKIGVGLGLEVAAPLAGGAVPTGNGCALAQATASTRFLASSASFFSCCFCSRKRKPSPANTRRKMIRLIIRYVHAQGILCDVARINGVLDFRRSHVNSAVPALAVRRK